MLTEGRRRIRFIAAILQFGLAFLLLHGEAAIAQGLRPLVSDAKPGDLRVLATAAIREPLDAVLAQAQRIVGHPIVVEYGSARGNLKDRILGGQDFEVALLLPDVNEELLRQAKVLPESYEIARVDVAIGLRGDALNLDVGSPAGLKSAMLNARSVRYAPIGAAILTVRKILSSLGIADSIHDSSRERAQIQLGPGEYELNLYPLSEILPNKALRNLGPVISEFQVPVIITAAIGRHANDETATRALIRFLQGPAIDAALAADGMTKGRVASGSPAPASK